MTAETDSRPIRCFAALEIPGAAKRRISAWQAAEGADAALRPVPEANLHVTLAFLGATAPERVDQAVAIVDGVEPLPVALALDLEAAPLPARRPRLFALGCRSTAAVALQAELAARLVAAGLYEPEERPFWPHITVFRVRPAKPGSRKPARVQRPPGPLGIGPEGGGGHTFGSVRVALYRSDLRPEGAIYSRLAATDLPQSGGRDEEVN